MPNRLIFSLRYANKLFLKFITINLAMIFFMTLFRVNLYFLSVHFHVSDPDFSEIIESFVTGLRLDLLIYGYILIPIVLLLMVQAVLEWWPDFVLWFYKIFFGVIWILICLINMIDFSFFAHEQTRMHSAQYHALDFEQVFAALQSIPMNYLMIFSAVTFLLLILGLFLLKDMKFGYWKDEYSPNRGSRKEIVLRILLPLILVSLLIIDDPDTKISSQEPINQMSLSPVWCIDK